MEPTKLERNPISAQEFELAETLGDILSRRIDLGRYFCDSWYKDKEHRHLKFDFIEPEKEGDL